MNKDIKTKMEALASQLRDKSVSPDLIERSAVQFMNELNTLGIAESKKAKIQDKIEKIRQSAREEKTVTSYAIKQNFANKFFIKHPKIAVVSLAFTCVGGLTVTAGIVSSRATASELVETSDQMMNSMGKGAKPELEDKGYDDQEHDVYYGPYLSDMPQKPLASHLSFDVNDNEALIEQSAQFIANSRACGLDFASEKWISKFMDFTYVMGLEEIDPMDYARLNYFNKTTQSIIDNYQECANEIAYDLFTVKPDTLLDYPIADKDSKEILMELQRLVAQYNVYTESGQKESAKEVAGELEKYFLDNFVHQDGRVYTRATYELVARFANIVDEILPKGLSKDITSILSEDLYTCGAKVPDGEKNKSERAQSETSIREMSDDKLAIAREYRDQELWNLSEIEYLTGIELEEEILESVYELDVEFVANPEKLMQTQKTTVISAKPSTPSVTLPNNVQVPEQAIIGLGLNPALVTDEQYETAVKKQFEETAQKDFEAAVALHRQGSSDAFYDGYNGNAFNPKQTNADYLEGYTWANYNEGVNSRPKEQSKTEFVDTPDQVVESNSVTITQGYVENPSNSNSTSNSQSTGNTTFEPVSEDTTIIIDEVIIEEDFVDVESYNDVDATVIEDNFVETPSNEVVEESSIEIETHFEPIASSQISQYKALRNMIDTVIMNPTYYVEEGTFALNNEEYEVQKTKC